MEKPGRNDPCLCGSGKKSKKCCEQPKAKKGFSATLIQGSASVGAKLSGLFQTSVSEKIVEKREERSLSEVVSITK